MPTFWVGQLPSWCSQSLFACLPTQGHGPMILPLLGHRLAALAGNLLWCCRRTYTILDPTRVARFMRASRVGNTQQGYIVTARQKACRGARSSWDVVSQFDSPGPPGEWGTRSRHRHGCGCVARNGFSMPGFGSLMVESVRALDTQSIAAWSTDRLLGVRHGTRRRLALRLHRSKSASHRVKANCRGKNKMHAEPRPY